MPAFTSETAKKARCRKGGLKGGRKTAQRYPGFLNRLRLLGLAKRQSRSALAKKEYYYEVWRPAAEMLLKTIEQLQSLIRDEMEGKSQLRESEKRIILGIKTRQDDAV